MASSSSWKPVDDDERLVVEQPDVDVVVETNCYSLAEYTYGNSSSYWPSKIKNSPQN